MGKRRRHTRPPGRPTLLTSDTKARLLQALELGVPVSIACEGANLSTSTFYTWMQRGHSEHEARALDEEPLDEEEAYMDLYREVQQARAKAAVRNVGVIQKAAQGGTVTETVKETLPDGTIRETVKRTGPDWRAAAWYLERSHRGEYAKSAEQVEISGAGGGPIQVTADAEDLAQRLAAHMAAGVIPAALPAGSDDPEG